MYTDKFTEDNSLKLQDLTAYEMIEDRDVDDLHSRGVLLRHKKSGARICLLLNDDKNKVFYIAFRTPPVNSTGLTHILEHSVLCGSEAFPVKDPFIELVKGSLNTFLNAITYPDKTVYPVASCSDKDFQNLMHVYLDAVFRPDIYKHKEIFRQEGWHYELENPQDDLKINGVVYSEMKGAFSSSDDLLEREVLNSLYPDTAYRFESGGDPKEIPNLTYEEFLDFHSKYYHPSNAYIYMYGDMDAAEKLQWLDETYLNRYDTDDFNTEIQMQKPFAEPLKISRKYSIAATEEEKDRTYLSWSWSVGTVLNKEEYLAFDALDYALLGSQGAPLKKALLDAGIGKDIQGGYDSSIQQPIFSVIAKNANIEDLERFRTIIMETLRQQTENGISEDALLASINNAEFRFREADFGNYPKGLMFGLQALDSWLYDERAPFMHLEQIETFEFLRSQIGTGYFENLVKKWLIDNPHSVIITMEPEKGLYAREEKELADKLAAYKASLSDQEVQNIVDFTKHLKEYQEAEELPENLEKIPMLSREDLKQTPDPLYNTETEKNGIPVLWHDIESNGIVYMDLLFDIGDLCEELVPYAGLLKLLTGYMDTEDYSYTELSNEINLHTGGISNGISFFVSEEDGSYRVMFEYRISALESKMEKALSLTESMMLRTKFDDDKRLKELLSQIKTAMQADLSGNGHLVSATRAMSYYQPRYRHADMTSGIEFYRLIDRLESDFDNVKEDLKEKMRSLAARIYTRDRLMVSITCPRASMEHAMETFSVLSDKLVQTSEEKDRCVLECRKKNEGFMDATQVQYVSLAGNYKKAGYEYTGAFRVLKTILSYDYLWLQIRVKGGAYGASSGFTRYGDIYFTSYRDPNLKKTLDSYRRTVDYLKTFDVSERDMTKYVIGTVSGMDTPLNPKAQGRRGLTAYLSGLTEEMLKKERMQVIQASAGDIRALSAPLETALSDDNICVIGNEEMIKKDKDLFFTAEPLF